MTIAAHEQTPDGRFVRQDDVFRDWVRADGSTPYPPVAGRYHLYVSLSCPWAHRTIIVRKLMGLERAIGMTVADPIRDESGWAFRPENGGERDASNGFTLLADAYRTTDPAYAGRVTVPVLWDKQTRRIVSNADDDIMRMFATEFEALAEVRGLDLYPTPLRAEIDALNDEIYESVNDGVYRAGFARSQAAYEAPARRLFETLDRLDARLTHRRFLFGAMPVETDWRLFVTLVRFDAVYYGHFKCNLRRIADYPNLSGYLRDLYQFRDVAETVSIAQIKLHYYFTQVRINPTRIVPIGPELDLDAPHGRERLG
jgi:putative glutathione S-transferase